MQEINLNGQSHDIVKENVAKLKQLFPEIVTEDNIDFDKLKAVLGDYIEKDDESYRFTWYGKRDAFRKSQIPSTGTLRPCVEDSKDWGTTQNLYIEGDNLEVLKLLQKSYNNKIKMIYIDPPYNKDKDFIYSDKWSDPIKEYKRITGQTDEDGNVISSETEDEGGRHTKWLNMMYPRLRLARNMLADNGIIFISIDDDEVANLKKLCDEVFGEENFLSDIIWQKKTGASDAKGIATITEHIIIYGKNITYIMETITKNKESYDINRYKYQDEFYSERGPYYIDNLDRGGLQYSDSLNYGILCPDGTQTYPNGRTEYINDGWIWKWSKQKFDWARANKFVEFRQSKLKKSGWSVCYKNYLLVDNEGNPIERAAPHKNLITSVLNADAAADIKALFDSTIFQYTKPVELMKTLIDFVNISRDGIVLDFFSGSSTTAHAVMKLNAEDGGNRKHIMVQLPEPTSEKDDAYKAGYKNICEIGKERIRRAGESIKEELKQKYDSYKQKKQQSIFEEDEQPPMNPDDLDIGFKVFKLDNSNLKKWSVDVGEYFYKESKEEQNAILTEMLGFEVDNFVEGRSELDVVYEVMLKYGLDLTYPVETYDFNGTNVYSIGYGGLIVCLDTNIKAWLADKIVELIKELEPSMVRVAVRDLSFESDSAKTNFKETLKNGVHTYFESSEDKAGKQNQFKFITI